MSFGNRNVQRRQEPSITASILGLKPIRRRKRSQQNTHKDPPYTTSIYADIQCIPNHTSLFAAISGPIHVEMPSLPNDPRPRYEGDAETLAAAILPSATNAGWLHYSTDMKDKIDVARIRTHAALIRRLYLLQANLSFTKTQVEAAMQIVLLKGHFSLADKHRVSWVKVTAQRMRVMCRHVSNTNTKATKPKWLKYVLYYEPPPPPPTRTRSDCSPGKESIVRSVSSSLSCDRSTAPPMNSPEADDDDATPSPARSSEADNKRANDVIDGRKRRREVLDRLWADHKRANDVIDGRKRRREVLWAGVHAGSGLPVEVRWRSDRTMLLSLFLADEQKLQAPKDKFPDEEVLKKLMFDLAGEYCQGIIEERDLYHERDKRAADVGVTLQSKKQGDGRHGAAAKKKAKKAGDKKPAAAQRVAPKPTETSQVADMQAAESQAAEMQAAQAAQMQAAEMQAAKIQATQAEGVTQASCMLPGEWRRWKMDLPPAGIFDLFDPVDV